MVFIEALDDDNFVAKFKFHNDYVNFIKLLPQRTFDKKVGGWVFPAVDLFILKKIAKEKNIPISVTEEVNSRYSEIADDLKRIKSIAEAKDTDHEILGLKEEVKLYNFQKVGVHFLDELRSSLMGFEMGLGKTPISIAVLSNSIQKDKSKKNLVIVPASMKYQWGYQVAKFSDYSYTLVEGKNREEQYRRDTNLIIVNYDLIWRDIDMIKDIEWDVCICDEIQRARNYKTDTFKALNKLNCKRKIGLTGTPIENDLMDLFTIMKFIDPRVFGKNVTSFIGRYCTLDFFNRIDHSKYKNLQEINKKLSFSMIRRRKRDVLDELPEKTVNYFYINLNPTERKHYKEIKNGILEDIKSGKIKHVATLAQVGYLRQLCDCVNLVIQKDKIISSKFEEMKKIIEELPKESKIVIFTQYARMAKIIQDNIGYKSVYLHGQVKNDCRRAREVEKDILSKNSKKKKRELDIILYEAKKDVVCGSCPYYNDDSKCHTRKKIQYQFDNEKDIKLFISTDAGKAGLDLQVANVLINYDLSFNPSTNEQRIARIDRMGQKSNKILIINFVCTDTIEEKVLKITEKKQELFDKVIDGIDEAEVEKVLLKKTNIKEIL